MIRFGCDTCTAPAEHLRQLKEHLVKGELTYLEIEKSLCRNCPNKHKYLTYKESFFKNKTT